jgi:hypothetical protein
MPILMAIVGVWLEHTWLRPDRRKRILLVEEAWHIINSPSVAQLFQRLLKFGRRLGLSFVAVVHHLSDVIDGAAAKEAAAILKMASTRTIYMQKSDEARATGRVLGLPRWAVEIIPTLSPGIAVWDVNGDVQVVKHIITEVEKPLVYTDRAMTESSPREGLDSPPIAPAAALPPVTPMLQPVLPSVARALPPTRAVVAVPPPVQPVALPVTSAVPTAKAEPRPVSQPEPVPAGEPEIVDGAEESTPPALRPVAPPALSAAAKPTMDDPELTALAAALFGPRAQTPSHPRGHGDGDSAR